MKHQDFILSGVEAIYRVETKESQSKKVEIAKKVTNPLKASKTQRMVSKFKV
jgi:hypothetical protein